METPIETLIQFFEQGIPFNAYLGMRIDSIEHRRVRIRLPYQPAFIGDPHRPALHGGLLSTLADTAGGLAIFARLGALHARVSTLDLRVDYYEPGRLEDVLADAEVIRMGNRVGVSRILLHHGDPAHLIAEGKGVYNVR